MKNKRKSSSHATKGTQTPGEVMNKRKGVDNGGKDNKGGDNEGEVDSQRTVNATSQATRS